MANIRGCHRNLVVPNGEISPGQFVWKEAEAKKWDQPAHGTVVRRSYSQHARVIIVISLHLLLIDHQKRKDRGTIRRNAVSDYCHDPSGHKSMAHIAYGLANCVCAKGV